MEDIVLSPLNMDGKSAPKEEDQERLIRKSVHIHADHDDDIVVDKKDEMDAVSLN